MAAIGLDLVRGAWERWGDQITSFLRDILAIESPPGGERACAERVAEEMRRAGLEEVSTDRSGNVIGRVTGAGAGRVLLNAHMDIVGAGDPADWTHPPFGGELVGDTIYGRGACDTKSSVAAQIFAAAALRENGYDLASNLTVAAVVMEEVGGIGTLGYLEDEGAPDVALVGEPSDDCLMIGHRGRVQIEVDFRGKAYHAAVEGAGVSPYPALAAYLQSIPGVTLPEQEIFGRASIEPTIVRSDNASPNVVPEVIHLVLDCRTVPLQDQSALMEELERRAEAALTEGVECDLYVPDVTWRTWTGLERRLPHVMPSFGTNLEDAVVTKAAAILAELRGEAPAIRPWKFATDGGHLTNAGARVIGFGPGRQERAHTVDEHITLSELRRGFEATLACAIALDEVVRSRA